MLKHNQLVFLLGLYVTGTAYGQYIDDHTRTATDSLKGDVFIQNPAAIFPNKTIMTYTRANTTNEYTAVAINNDTPDERNYKIQHNNHGVGLLYPLGGGAAVGVIAQQVDRDLEVTNTNNVEPLEEEFRTKHFAGRFILDITQKVRGGFAYRVTEEKANVLGEFNIDGDDRTTYTAKMTGYAMGVFYEESKYGIGLGHAPGMRGKAEVQGEEKITTHRGVTALDWYYDTGKVRYGATIKRWQYQRDDRAEQVQSLQDQRGMSLNGLDLEQHLFLQEMHLLGLDYKINNEVFLTATVGRKDYLFLFEGENVPGDNPQIEFPFNSMVLKAGLVYEKGQLRFTGIYSQEERERSDFRDLENWLSTGTYQSYSAKEETFAFSLSYLN